MSMLVLFNLIAALWNGVVAYQDGHALNWVCCGISLALTFYCIHEDL